MNIDFKGFSVRSVMKRAGLDESTYYRIKKSERQPRQSTLDKIEKAIQEMTEEKIKYAINTDSLKKMQIRIVEYRVESGTKQKEFLNLCGVSATTWHRFQLTGAMTLPTFKKIIDFLEENGY